EAGMEGISIIPNTIAIVIARRVQPIAPRTLGKTKHLKWIFEKMVAKIDIMDMQAIRFCQRRQSTGDPLHVVKVFIHGAADQIIDGLKDALVGRIAYIRLK